jgi:hypothetical protein
LSFLKGRESTGRLAQAGQPSLEQAVHYHVGIAANGRSEVQVGIGGEAEVPHIGPVIGGLLERAQGLEGECPLRRVAMQPLQHSRKTRGCARLLLVDLDAVALGHGREVVHLLGVGRGMDSPQGGLVARLKAFAHRNVGGQHELLDHGVGMALARIAARASDVAHQPGIVVVQFHHNLRQIQVQGATLLAPRPQLARQRIQRAQGREKRFVLLVLALRLAGQGGGHPGIIQAGARMDHGRAEVLVPHREIAVEIDANDHGQAILPGQQ